MSGKLRELVKFPLQLGFKGLTLLMTKVNVVLLFQKSDEKLSHNVSMVLKEINLTALQQRPALQVAYSSRGCQPSAGVCGNDKEYHFENTDNMRKPRYLQVSNLDVVEVKLSSCDTAHLYNTT